MHSICRNSRIKAATSPWAFANATSGNCSRRLPTTRSTCSCPDSSVPSCMIVSWRRSIRLHSQLSPLPFSARRAPRARAATFRSPAPSSPSSASAIAVAETSLFRVPQLLEKMMPFCILIGAMTCYLALSRRLELVVARAAGVSAWQFIAPALASAVVLGILATTAYNPISANLRELSKRMEAELFGSAPGGGIQDASGFWINQVNSDGHAVISAARSEQQGVRLTGLTVFRFDTDYQFKERIEAREATLEEGRWLFKSARRYSLDGPP